MTLNPVRALVPALVVLAVALSGCSGGAGDAGDAASSGGQAPASAAGQRNAATAGEPAAEGYDAQAPADSLLSVVTKPGPAEPQQALIKKGNVSLRADDVGKAQFDVQRVVDQRDGKVTEEKTTTDEDGRPAYTRMVLRIPAAQFDDAMAELKDIEGAELESADTSEDDVTTKLIDTQTRLKVQRRSIERITTLFDRAQSIRDIMAIEAQLSRRQADLDSLERQAAYLQGQTTLSTIVVSIDEIPAKKAAPKKEDDAGFVAGLSAGWHGLEAFATGLATVLGALLPWLVVIVVLGFPTLLLVRAARRRRPPPEPEPTEA
jgi:VIT1/CCC1 family predicted Fe2+/Mn2+ transporter